MNGYLMNKYLFNDIVRATKANAVSKSILGLYILSLQTEAAQCKGVVVTLVSEKTLPWSEFSV